MALSIMESLAERLSREPELTRLIFAILDPQLPNDLIANIRARLNEMIENAPMVAWMYDHDEGIYFAQSATQEGAAAIIDAMLGEPADYDRMKRCEAMDGLGYNRLHGLYVNLFHGALCAEFASCGTRIIASERDSGRLVNADTGGEAIVVGDALYCSRFCADHAG